MKSTGIVRNIDFLGRVVIPKELRKTLEIKEGDPLEVFVAEDNIILRKYVPGCVLCGSGEEAKPTVNGRLICKTCRVTIASTVMGSKA